MFNLFCYICTYNADAQFLTNCVALLVFLVILLLMMQLSNLAIGAFLSGCNNKNHASMLLTFCLLLLPLWESVIVLCFVVRYFISILVLQSS